MPWPYGGKQRQIMIDIDPPAPLRLGPVARRRRTTRSPRRTSSLPSGTAKIGTERVPRPSSTAAPTPSRSSATCPSRSSTARRSTSATSPTCATGIAPADEHRPRATGSAVRADDASSRTAGASHARHRQSRERRRCRSAWPTLPQGAQGRPCFFDQSLFVRASVEGVVKEAAIAAGLTALMILLFLGELAEHAHRRHLDPAVDPGLDHRPRASSARRST